MVEQGIVLGHIIFSRGLEVDKVKIDIIFSLLYPVNIQEVCSFLKHVGFYRRFIKEFLKYSISLCKLFKKDNNFMFDDACKYMLDELKKRLTLTSIM